MSDTEKQVRLINAYDLENIIKERYGLSACGIIEAVRDTPTYDFPTFKEDKEKTE